MQKSVKILLRFLFFLCLFLWILVGIMYLADRAEENKTSASSVPVPTPHITPAPTPVPDDPPEIELTDGEQVTVEASLADYTDPGWTAADAFGADLTDAVTTEGTVIPWKVGEYAITYRVTDSRGRSSEARRTVTVVPRPMPETVIPEGNIIYLTFDDGPGPETERLLDTLDRYGVKATFFVTAVNSDYTYLIGEIAARGHAVGIHSYTHDYNRIYASEEAFFADWKSMRDVIVSYTGREPRIGRFPGGSGNTVSAFNPGIMTALVADLEDLGLPYFDWNVTAADTASNATYYTTLENMTEGISEHSTAVCLQHDVNPWSVDAVRDIIAWALQRGYAFRTLDETSYGAHHGVNN